MKVILFVALILSGIMSAGSEATERSQVEPGTIWPETPFTQTGTPNETTAGLQVGEPAGTEAIQQVRQTAGNAGTGAGSEVEQMAEAESTEDVPSTAVPTAEALEPVGPNPASAPDSPQTASDGDSISARGENEPILLRSVQELTLYDDRAAVIGKLGEPSGVTQDEFYSELVILEYEQVRVVFNGEFIQSIDIPGDAEGVLLDDVYVPMTLTDLKEALGEPDYAADDGIVFQRDEALLKLFIDGATGELDYVSYYHLATV